MLKIQLWDSWALLKYLNVLENTMIIWQLHKVKQKEIWHYIIIKQNPHNCLKHSINHTSYICVLVPCYTTWNHPRTLAWMPIYIRRIFPFWYAGMLSVRFLIQTSLRMTETHPILWRTPSSLGRSDASGFGYSHWTHLKSCIVRGQPLRSRHHHHSGI